MDMANLLISLVFGSIGMGLFLYGKNQQRVMFLAAGAALMIFPYFIPNAIALTVVCAALTGLPFVVDV